MKIAFVMIDPMIGKRAHRAGGAVYALNTYLKHKNPHREDIYTKIFNFNSLYEGPINLYISAISAYNPDVIAFSTYCWNVELVMNMIKHIKKLLPNVKIILGGPEVSYNSQELLEEFKDIDMIIRGEGEVTFSEVTSNLYQGVTDFSKVNGITYRDIDGTIACNEDRPLHPVLDDFPSPFLTGEIELADSDGEVAFETVRGCKFRCSYCLHTKGLSYVREYSFERIEEELRIILKSPYISIIWFLDPTFNADEERALKILKIIEKYNPNMALAFEIRADLLTDRLIEQFGRVNVAEVGIGLQSYSEEVNKHVHRKNNIDNIEAKLDKLKKAIAHSCKQFDIDLIYGLSGDSYENYKKSVDYIIKLGGRIYYQPLRVFKGTELYKDIKKYGIIYNKKAPYNVLCNSTYTLEQMTYSYCLNVGIDYINRGGIYREIIDIIVNYKNYAYSDVLEAIGKFFWERQVFDIFRISNWSPDDRNDVRLTADFKEFINDYIDKEDKLFKQSITDKISSFLSHRSDKESDGYSNYGYFHLTI